MLRAGVLALILLAPLAQGGIALAYEAASASLTLLPSAQLPITLSAGATGSTAVGAYGTSASSSVTPSTLAASTHNTTVARNTGGEAVRVRLVLTGTDGLTAECVRCDLVLRHGASTWTQLTVANGVVTRATGEWVTLEPGTAAPSVVWLHAIGRGSVFSDRWQTLEYALEIEPAGGGSPAATYVALSTRYQV